MFYTKIFQHYKGSDYIRFAHEIQTKKTATEIDDLFRGKSLVTKIRDFYFHKWIYFSSFEAANCVSNSSFKWTKDKDLKFSRKGLT